MFIFWLLLFTEYQALMFNHANISHRDYDEELHTVICQFGPYGDFINENDKEDVWQCQTNLSDKYIIRYSQIRCIDEYNLRKSKYNLNCSFSYRLILNQQYLQSRNKSCSIGSQEICFVTEYVYIDDMTGVKLLGSFIMMILIAISISIIVVKLGITF